MVRNDILKPQVIDKLVDHLIRDSYRKIEEDYNNCNEKATKLPDLTDYQISIKTIPNKHDPNITPYIKLEPKQTGLFYSILPGMEDDTIYHAIEEIDGIFGGVYESYIPYEDDKGDVYIKLIEKSEQCK